MSSHTLKGVSIPETFQESFSLTKRVQNCLHVYSRKLKSQSLLETQSSDKLKSNTIREED